MPNVRPVDPCLYIGFTWLKKRPGHVTREALGTMLEKNSTLQKLNLYSDEIGDSGVQAWLSLVRP